MSNAELASSSQPPRITRQRVLQEGRSLLRLAAPIMLISLVNMGMSITDTMMVSALFGAEALAAVAVGSDLYSILFYPGAGVLGGLAPFYTAAVVRADPCRADGDALRAGRWPPLDAPRRLGHDLAGPRRIASALPHAQPLRIGRRS